MLMTGLVARGWGLVYGLHGEYVENAIAGLDGHALRGLARRRCLFVGRRRLGVAEEDARCGATRPYSWARAIAARRSAGSCPRPASVCISALWALELRLLLRRR